MSLGLVGPTDRLSYVCTSATLAHENNRIASQFVNYMHGSGWLGCRVVSVLDSGVEGHGLKSQPRHCRVTVLGKLFAPIMPLLAKWVAALLRVARVTAGLAESNGSLPPGL